MFLVSGTIPHVQMRCILISPTITLMGSFQGGCTKWEINTPRAIKSGSFFFFFAIVLIIFGVVVLVNLETCNSCGRQNI